jgi:hypothetical protein
MSSVPDASGAKEPGQASCLSKPWFPCGRAWGRMKSVWSPCWLWDYLLALDPSGSAWETFLTHYSSHLLPEKTSWLTPCGFLHLYHVLIVSPAALGFSCPHNSVHTALSTTCAHVLTGHGGTNILPENARKAQVRAPPPMAEGQLLGTSFLRRPPFFHL